MVHACMCCTISRAYIHACDRLGVRQLPSRVKFSRDRLNWCQAEFSVASNYYFRKSRFWQHHAAAAWLRANLCPCCHMWVSGNFGDQGFWKYVRGALPIDDKSLILRVRKLKKGTHIGYSRCKNLLCTLSPYFLLTNICSPRKAILLPRTQLWRKHFWSKNSK